MKITIGIFEQKMYELGTMNIIKESVGNIGFNKKFNW